MTYDYSVENLWKVVSSPNYLNNVHPFCKENSIIKWNNDHHEDKILYLNNKTYIRKFVSWKALKGYDLWIGDNNKDQSFVEWRLEKAGNRSKLTITVYPFLLSNWPRILSFLPYFLYINIKLKSYLFSVLSGIDWYIKENTPVPKNQFGKHSWFS
jgi:hypothetical protein|tara:strand:+ start:1114 stop:1578 length:465 start_codon:yes stop_codon:yes gene_type:complete